MISTVNLTIAVVANGIEIFRRCNSFCIAISIAIETQPFFFKVSVNFIIKLKMIIVEIVSTPKMVYPICFMFGLVFVF